MDIIWIIYFCFGFFVFWFVFWYLWEDIIDTFKSDTSYYDTKVEKQKIAKIFTKVLNKNGE